MNTIPVITANSITGIDGLVKRPVYFVKLNNSPSPSLVIKGDAMADHAAVSIPWGSKLMKNVQNSLVNTKIMTAQEISIFKNVALRSFRKGTIQQDYLGGSFTWVKMPYVRGLSDAEFIDDDYRPDLKQIKRVITKLSDSGTWQELGTVVAVDIFNGNNDRFTVHDRGNMTVGNWSNRGNLMFLDAGQGHTTRVIGLDTFHAGSGVSNLQSGGVFPELKILVDSAQCLSFATRGVRSIGEQFRDYLRDAGTRDHFDLSVRDADGKSILRLEVSQLDKLFVPYAVDFAQGITAGSFRLQQYLRQKLVDYGVRTAAGAPARPTKLLPGQRPATAPGAGAGAAAPARQAIPQGILDRMKFLGWL